MQSRKPHAGSTTPFPMILMLLVVLLLAFGGEDANSAEAVADLSWEHPSERVSGEPLPVDALDGYVLEYRGEQRGTGTLELDVVTDYTDSFMADYGQVSVEYRIKSRDTFGLESAWSDWAEYNATVKPEAAPSATSLTVTPGTGESSDSSGAQ